MGNGYTCVDGEIVIVPEQAKVVRNIFDLYLQGLTLGHIKDYLEAQGIKTVTGKEIWDTKTIQRMLTNEKYKGDTMLQKTFIENFMTGKKSKNIGQRNMYYVMDHRIKGHSRIIKLVIHSRFRQLKMNKRG